MTWQGALIYGGLYLVVAYVLSVFFGACIHRGSGQ
jgi:hypothetical protein